MSEAQKRLECPACQDSDAAVLFRSSNGYAIVRCSRCKLVYTDMRDAPPPATLYPAFDQTESVIPKVFKSSLGVFTRQREGLVRSVKPTGRLLDFGCGSGAFARWMADAGYDVVGLEPFSLGRPTRANGLLLVREPLETAIETLGQFDVITLWHVLEHMNRPTELLSKLSHMLKPDGVLLVSVPNFQSWQSRVFRGSWFHLDPPRHVVHFEEDTLEHCLRAAGFEPTRRWKFLPEYGSSGWVQSTLNQFLPHDNYLYEIIKDRGAIKKLGAASHVLHFTASLLGSAPTFMLSMPIEAIASGLDRGAALTFAARRSANGSSPGQ